MKNPAHCTVSVKVAEWLSPPATPFTVRGKVPTGVLLAPRFGPLHPARTKNANSANVQMSLREVLRARIRAENRASARLRMVQSQIKGNGGVPRGRRRGGTKATVVTVAEEVAVAFADGVTVLGVSVHVEAAGAPVQVRETAEAKPLREVTVTEKVVELPAVTVACAGFSAIEKSACPGVEPLPVSVTV